MRLFGGKEYPCDLRSAGLQGADLQGADLQGADLRYADLRYADLRYANLRHADLRYANLRGAGLQGADLQGADLQGANLRSANLRSANLRGAGLQGADLQNANLWSANLQNANLWSANLRGADLRSAENIPEHVFALTCITPEGELIGYKKLAFGVICKLKIPSEAKRSNATGRKCRAEFAVVLEGEGVSRHDCAFTYKIGATVWPDSFDEDRWNECSNGIHFLLTRWEAENY